MSEDPSDGERSIERRSVLRGLGAMGAGAALPALGAGPGAASGAGNHLENLDEELLDVGTVRQAFEDHSEPVFEELTARGWLGGATPGDLNVEAAVAPPDYDKEAAVATLSEATIDGTTRTAVRTAVVTDGATIHVSAVPETGDAWANVELTTGQRKIIRTFPDDSVEVSTHPDDCTVDECLDHCHCEGTIFFHLTRFCCPCGTGCTECFTECPADHEASELDCIHSEPDLCLSDI